MNAFANGDSVAAAGIYAPDCHMMPYGRETIHGRASKSEITTSMYQLFKVSVFIDDSSDAEAYIKQDISVGAKHLTVETNEVNGSGDWAYERGTYRLDGNRGGETGS